jgi:hypothetical protein
MAGRHSFPATADPINGTESEHLDHGCRIGLDFKLSELKLAVYYFVPIRCRTCGGTVTEDSHE